MTPTTETAPAPLAQKTNQTVRFSVENGALGRVLKQLTSIVDHSQVIQVLSFLKCTLEKNTLSLIASNSELEMHVRIPVQSSSLETGQHQFTLPCKKLFEITRTLSASASVEFIQEASWTQIRVHKTNFKVAALPVDTFPLMDTQAPEVTLEVHESALLEGLKKTSFAMAVNDVRFFLNGLLLQVNDKLTLAATDGHRLSCHSLQRKGECTPSQYILPRKTVTELCKYLQDEDRPIALSFNKNHFSFATDTMHIYSNLIDGEYPQYQALIPKQYAFQATIASQDLKASLLRLVPLSNEKYHGAKFRFTHSLLHITTQNLHHEEAHDEISINADGEIENIEIGFNIHYLLDILQVIESEHITIGLTDATRSAAFEEVGEGYDGVFIVMPLDL